MSASTARCELAREQADSLREKVEERAHRGNHSATPRENRVHDSHVSLQRRQQSDERAALQIVRNGEMWDKDCTNPLQRRAPQREEIVRAQARQVYQFGELAIHSDEAPGRVLVGAPHRKRRHSSNILDRLWFAVRGNEFGTGDKDHLVGPERAHGEIGILQWWLAYPHSDVEAFVDDVDTPIGSGERDTHSRMLCEEAREDIGDAALQQTGGTRDAHEPLWRAKKLAHRVFRRLRFIEERQAMAMERLACFGERETPRRAVDQAHAELALQRSDAAAKLRRLQAQRLRRRRIGAEIGDLGEEIEIVEVLDWSHVLAEIILFRANMYSIYRSVQRIIAQLASRRGSEGAFVCGGTQLCRIIVANFWDSPLAQSQCLRPPAWWLHKVIPRAARRRQYRHKQASLNGGRRNPS